MQENKINKPVLVKSVLVENLKQITKKNCSRQILISNLDL